MSNGGSGASLLIFLLPVALIAFMVWSQRRRQREVQSLQSGLSVGDRVCTTSGLFGTITSIEDQVVTLEVAPGVQLRFDRRAIGSKTLQDPVSTQSTQSTQSNEGAESVEGSAGGSVRPADESTSGRTSSPTDPSTTE